MISSQTTETIVFNVHLPTSVVEASAVAQPNLLAEPTINPIVGQHVPTVIHAEANPVIAFPKEGIHSAEMNLPFNPKKVATWKKRYNIL